MVRKNGNTLQKKRAKRMKGRERSRIRPVDFISGNAYKIGRSERSFRNGVRIGNKRAEAVAVSR